MLTARVLLASTLAAATLPAGCATQALNNAEGWQLTATKRLDVYTPGGRPHGETLLALEQAYASLSGTFFKGVDAGKIDVLLLPLGAVEGLLGLHRSGGGTLATVPGSRIGARGLVILQDDLGNAELDRANALLTHVFIDRMAPAAPLWFHVGFRQYARTVEYKEGGGQRVACFGRPYQGKAAGYEPIEKMAAMTWDAFNAEEATWFRGTSRVLIDYVMHGDEGRNVAKMGPLVAGIVEGKPSIDLIRAAFDPLALAALDTKIVEHGYAQDALVRSETATRGLCPIGFPIPGDKAPDATAHPAMPVAPEDIRTLMSVLKRLPGQGGYAEWYPADVMAKIK